MVSRITNDLEQAILQGKYVRDDRLPSLAEMARSYNVSYGTARSAVAELQERGVVSMEPGRGTFVRHRSLLRFIWTWIGQRRNNWREGVVDAVVAYIHEQARFGARGDVALDLTFLDVRHLPSAERFAESCRLRGADGLIVSGFGKEYAPYVEELSGRLPVVAPFVHGEPYPFTCVGPDVEGAIQAVVGAWAGEEAERIGLLATTLEHPNYRCVVETTRREAAAHGLAVRDEDVFVGPIEHMPNWLIGRMVRGAAPRHWVTAVEGAAAAVRNAAGELKMDWRRELQVLTFSILPCAERFDHRFFVGQHDLEQTIETSVKQLRALCLGEAEAGGEVLVPMTLHRPDAAGPETRPDTRRKSDRLCPQPKSI